MEKTFTGTEDQFKNLELLMEYGSNDLPTLVSSEVRLELRYTDSSNWKDDFEVILPKSKIDGLEIGSEFEMGEYGTLQSCEYFGSGIHPESFGMQDHNILEVVDIIEIE